MTGHECPDCQFVAHRSCIVVTPSQRGRARITLGMLLKSYLRMISLEDHVISLGRFTMPEWSGHAMWYLFHCLECETFSIDYLHGYSHSGHLFLRCDECKQRWIVKKERFYHDNGIEISSESQVRVHRNRLP